MSPEVTAFFDEATNTISYVVRDPQGSACAIVDSVLDFDYASGRTDTRFVQVGDADDIVTSTDGTTWSAPSVLPAGCGASVQTQGGIAYGNGVLLVMGGDGVACSSTDDGDTFTRVDLGASIASHLVWTGTDFWAFGGGDVWRSPDGQTWTSTPIAPAGTNPGPVAVDDSGQFVAIEGAWGQWYADQQAWHSADGVTWTETDPYTGGHPVRAIASGWVTPSAECP